MGAVERADTNLRQKRGRAVEREDILWGHWREQTLIKGKREIGY